MPPPMSPPLSELRTHPRIYHAPLFHLIHGPCCVAACAPYGHDLRGSAHRSSHVLSYSPRRLSAAAHTGLALLISAFPRPSSRPPHALIRSLLQPSYDTPRHDHRDKYVAITNLHPLPFLISAILCRPKSGVTVDQWVFRTLSELRECLQKLDIHTGEELWSSTCNTGTEEKV
jgi:hypothetical protein